MSYPDTEFGNAQRFRDMCDGEVKWDPKRQTWVVWDGTAWVKDDGSRVMQRMGQMANLMLFEASQAFTRSGGQVTPEAAKDAMRAQAWALRSQDHRVPQGAMVWLKSDPDMQESGWDEDNDELGVRNGKVNLVTGRFSRRGKQDKIISSAGVEFDPTELCPEWRKFLKEVLVDDSTIWYVQKAVGYSLTGSASEQVLFYCVGEGSNGKSTFFNVLKYILGDYQGTAQTVTFLRGRRDTTWDLAQLQGKRFVSISEPDAGGRWDEGRIKEVTGGEPVTAEHKYKDPFTFTPQFKLWVTANDYVSTEDYSEGFWRRVIPIRFPNSFPVDGGRLESTLKAEASGILNWAVEGGINWRREGLWRPQAIQESMSNYRTTQLQDARGMITDFLKDRVEVDDTARTPSNQLYDEYKVWARAKGEKDYLKMAGFTRQIRAHGVVLVRHASGNMLGAKIKPVFNGRSG